MPVHKIRKRYILFRWQHDRKSIVSREELDRLLSRGNPEERTGTGKPQTRLVFLDQSSRMGIARTTHTLLENVKILLEEDREGRQMGRFEVISVSGTIKKLKLKMAKPKPAG